VHFGPKYTIEHEYEVGVCLSESVVQFHIRRLLAEESL